VIKATYLDSSAIIKLAVAELESSALRRYLRRRKPYVSSALARAEVGRTLLPFGPAATRRGDAVLARIDLIRVSDAVLRAAGSLLPEDMRTLDAIHLVTAQRLGEDLAQVVTYDARMKTAADTLGLKVVAPA
jgi:predicted nucleic acid-binding protein